MDPRLALTSIANRNAYRTSRRAAVTTWTTWVRIGIPQGALAADATALVTFDVEFTEEPTYAPGLTTVDGTNPEGRVPFAGTPVVRDFITRRVADVADVWTGCKVDLAVQGEPGLQVNFQLTFTGMAIPR